MALNSCRIKAGNLRLQTVVSHIAASYTNGHKQSVPSHPLNSSRVKYTTKSEPSICVNPQVALYDEKVKIELTGFPCDQDVTVHGQFVQGKEKILFASCGHYRTDTDGRVNMTQQHSVGGTYTGLEPMGILWSLKPAPGYPSNTRMAINFTDHPSCIVLHSYLGHLDLADIYGAKNSPKASVASTSMERWFRWRDVTRTEVEAGNVRGVLFLPPGDGPFQGVIDMFGSSGGVIEYRAALLASRGFATLSLPYFKYKDLPKTLLEVTYDYFQEAAEWFSQHPRIYHHGIGVVSVSKGVEFALCMAAYSSHVRAVVTINGCPYISTGTLQYKGETILTSPEMNITDEDFTDEGLDLRNAFEHNGEIIPVWRGKAKHLMLVSLDDFQVPVNVHQKLLDVCPKDKLPDIEVAKYPGAGHLLEPPYTCLCRTAVNKAFGIEMKFGGQPKEHAHAQEHAWQKTLKFLKDNIPTGR